MQLTLTSKTSLLKRKSMVGQSVVVLLALQLLFLSAFVAMSLPTPTAKNLRNFAHNCLEPALPYLPASCQLRLEHAIPDIYSGPLPVRFGLYVPETPAAIFVGYVLGPWLGAITSLAFVILGLIGPLIGIHPFASGGGLDYYRQPSFGYLMGMVLASFVSGRISVAGRTSLRQALSVLGGLLCVHILGLTYLLGSCLMGSFSEVLSSCQPWHQWAFEEIRNLTWYTLPYDLIFSMALIALGFPVKWLVVTLTAPDIGLKGNRSQLILEQLEE